MYNEDLIMDIVIIVMVSRFIQFILIFSLELHWSIYYSE
jgi:hypothetical protein